MNLHSSASSSASRARTRRQAQVNGTHWKGAAKSLAAKLSVTLAPVLFGTGIRLFDRVDPARLALGQARTDASSRVTHLTYTVGKR